MSTVPIARQVRRAVKLVDGTQKFEITTTIIDAGDLPFTSLFVVTVNDTSDPKADVLARIATPLDFQQADPDSPLYVKIYESDVVRFGQDDFARIANVNDVTALVRDRTDAVRQGKTEYLTSAVTLLFDDVTTAQNAYNQLLARLSELVLAWRQFNTDFGTNPFQDYNLPQPSNSVETQLTNAYNAAALVLKAAQADRDVAAANSAACKQTCDANKKIYAFLASDVAFLQRAKVTVTALNASTTGGTCDVAPTVLDPVRAFCLNGGDPSSYEALLTKKLSDLATYQSLVRDCDTKCHDLENALLQAQALVNTAQSAVTKALSQVLEVCPTFSPGT